MEARRCTSPGSDEEDASSPSARPLPVAWSPRHTGAKARENSTAALTELGTTAAGWLTWTGLEWLRASDTRGQFQPAARADGLASGAFEGGDTVPGSRGQHATSRVLQTAGRRGGAARTLPVASETTARACCSRSATVPMDARHASGYLPQVDKTDASHDSPIFLQPETAQRIRFQLRRPSEARSVTAANRCWPARHADAGCAEREG
jgi:hypothetical protein